MLTQALEKRLGAARGLIPVPSHLRQCLRPRCLGDSSSNSAGGGNESVQDALSDIIQIQVRKQEAKEVVLADLEKRKEKLRKMGEEVLCGFDEEADLNKMRLDLAASVSLAESLEELRKLEEQVQGVRDQLRDDRLELRNWETKSVADRSKGLFFQNLYTAPDEPLEKDDQGNVIHGQRLQAAPSPSSSSEVVEEAAQPSTLKLYVFTYLATVLFFALLIDLSGGNPQFGLDFIYATLFAGLGGLAWSERQALMDLTKDGI